MNTSRPSEDGSIPLVLLVTILVGGLVAALVTTVVGTQRSVVFDRVYTEAITVADAGVQQSLTHLTTLSGSEPIGTVVTSDDGVGGGAYPTDAERSLGLGTFTWTATKTGPVRWDVRAEGTIGDVTRVVEAGISANQAYFLAAFADLGIVFPGGNDATSYPSGGNGAIGSNNEIVMRGNSTADLIFLYGNGSCDGNGCSTGITYGYDEPLDMDAIRGVVDAEHQDLCAGVTYSSWVASRDARASTIYPGTYELDAGDVICATDVTFDADVLIRNASQDNPVKIMNTGNVRASNSRYVNCTGCTAASQPASGALRIFSQGPEFYVGNQSFFAAATLAPNAACQGNPSNAQTDYFGTIICEDMGNQGGWDFHFDENLLDIGAGVMDITAYREETVDTTSID